MTATQDDLAIAELSEATLRLAAANLRLQSAHVNDPRVRANMRNGADMIDDVLADTCGCGADLMRADLVEPVYDTRLDAPERVT